MEVGKPEGLEIETLFEQGQKPMVDLLNFRTREESILIMYYPHFQLIQQLTFLTVNGHICTGLPVAKEGRI